METGLLVMTNLTLREVLQGAYRLAPGQSRLISGGPSWMDSEDFNIEIKAQESPNAPQMIPMLQSLLVDQFKLAVHVERQVVPVYALEVSEVGQLGPGLRAHSDDAECWDARTRRDPPPAPIPGKPFVPTCGGLIARFVGETYLASGNRTTMQALANHLSGSLDRPVLDRTELNGSFDLDLTLPNHVEPPDPPTLPLNRRDPSLLIGAVQNQFGLKLVPTNGPVEVLVIDHVELPTEGSFPN